MFFNEEIKRHCRGHTQVLIGGVPIRSMGSSIRRVYPLLAGCPRGDGSGKIYQILPFSNSLSGRMP